MEIRLPDLSGSTALVTGAGRGIGRATAESLARCGARVMLMARSRDDIEDAAAAIRAKGDAAHAVQGDVSSWEDVVRVCEAAGPIDILVNNAGVVWPIAPAAGADPHDWLRSVEINLGGVFLPCHAVLPSMLQRDRGHIVTISSGAARGSTPGWSAYSAAKAGVEAMMHVLALEIGNRNVRTNVVRPGIVDTGMQAEIRASSAEQFGEANLARYRAYKEQGKLRPPEHAARLIVWLLSDDAADLNGQTVAIDDPDIAPRIGLQPIGR